MKTIYISSKDYDILSSIVLELSRVRGEVAATVTKLKEELQRAVIVHPSSIPATTVTLNSGIHLRDLITGDLEDWIITLPEHADSSQKRISILAPIGTALIGFSEGDEIIWDTPGGKRQWRLEKVQQNAFTVPTLLDQLIGRR